MTVPMELGLISPMKNETEQADLSGKIRPKSRVYQWLAVTSVCGLNVLPNRTCTIRPRTTLICFKNDATLSYSFTDL